MIYGRCREEMEKRFELNADVKGVRIDKFLADRLKELSRSAVKGLIEDGFVLVDGQPVKPSYKLRGDEHISVIVPPPPPLEPVPIPIPLDVVYEDDWLIVINKPAGLVVHPASGHWDDTLVNALLARWPELRGLSDRERLGIVHRLDKGTSGLIVVAKDERTQRELQRQFKERTVHKVYLVLVKGILKPPEGRVEAPIARHPRHRKKMAVVEGGREAVTEYKVLEYFKAHTYLEAHPKTGRTHQIRVHFSHLGHPVVGDDLYGRRSTSLGLDRPFLHAYILGFYHPASGKYIEMKAPLPKELEAILVKLRNQKAKA